MRILSAFLVALCTVIISCISAQDSQGIKTEVIAAPIQAVSNPCLDQDVWVYIKHKASEKGPWHPPCIVVVHIPKHSLSGDFQNCPAQDTKLVGQGRTGVGLRAGYRPLLDWYTTLLRQDL